MADPALFPTAQDVARAVVLAAQFTEEDPEAVFTSQQFSRTRVVALVALHEAFPTAQQSDLSRMLNHPEPRGAASVITHARKAAWWQDAWVDEIVGAMVAPAYGERAL